MSEIHSKIIEHFQNKENPIILDVGCYLGEDGIEYAYKFPNGKVFGFEADPRNCSYMYKNIQFPNNFELVQGAISNINGSLPFFPSVDIDFSRPWTQSGSLRKPHKHLDNYTVRFDKSIDVPCQTLDNWYRNSSVYKQEIQLIHCDLNGADGDMIEGASGILQNTRLVYVECFDEELYLGMKNTTWITNELNKLGFEYILEYGHNRCFRNNKLN